MTTATKQLRLWEEWQQAHLETMRAVFLGAGMYLSSILTFRMHKGEPRTEMFQTDGTLRGEHLGKMIELACERAKAEGYAILIEGWTSFDMSRAGQVKDDPLRGESLFASFHHRYLPGASYGAVIHRDPLRVDPWTKFEAGSGWLVKRAGMTGNAS